MSWLYNPSSWVDGVTIPHVQDYQNIASDIQSQGGNADSAGYGRANVGFINFKPGELPGAIYGVTAATWANGVVTLTIGAHDITVGQHVAVSGITPNGYNIGDAPVTAIGTTSISYAVTNNPGAWASGGTVTVGTSLPAAGMLVASPALPASLYFYDGTKWTTLGSSAGAASGVSDVQIGNVNANGYGAYSQSFLGFRPGDLPGTQYNVQAATWASNVATLTIGANNLVVGQHISLTGANPVGWNVPDAQVTNVSGGTIQINMSTNPGAWTGGGTVSADLLTTPVLGMMAVGPNNQLLYYNGSAWTQVGGGLLDPTTTRGDLIVKQATGAPVRLPIGATDGLVLMVDSSKQPNMGWNPISTTTLGAVPTTRNINTNTGSGLKGGGSLASDLNLTADVKSVAGRIGAVVLSATDVTGVVPNTTQIIAGPGISISPTSGQLTGNVTVSANVVSVFGRGGAVVLTANDITAAGGVAATYQVIAGYGLTGGGALTGNVTIAAKDDASVQKTGFLQQGNNVAQRSYLNFIPSGNITVNVNDVPTGTPPRVDVTIGTASAATTTVAVNNNIIGTGSVLNLLQGSNVALSGGLTGNNINVTISASGGGSGGGGSQTPWLTDIDAATKRLYDLKSINGSLSSISELGIGTDTPSGALEVSQPNPSGRTNITFSNPATESVANRVRLRMGPSAIFVGQDNQPYMEGMNLDATGNSGLGFGTYSFSNTSQYENMRLVPWASGQVYIGTTSPLSAGGVASGGNERLHVGGSAIIGNTPVSSSAILPGGSQPLLVLTDQNNPTAYLSIQQLSTSGSHAAGLQLYANSVGWLLLNMGTRDSTTSPTMNRFAILAPGQTEVFSIQSTGLVVAPKIQSTALQFTSGGITFADSTFQGTAFPGVAASQTPWVTDIEGATHILKNVGQIGIGTETPGANLEIDVNGASVVAVVLKNTHGTAGDTQFIDFSNSACADFAYIGGTADSATDGHLSFWTKTGAGPIAERMRITGTGLVGIGTTAPAYPLGIVTSAATQLHLTGTGADDGMYLLAYSANNCIVSSGTAYSGSGSSWNAKAASGGSWIDLLANQINFVVIPSGQTVGSVITSPNTTLTIQGVNVGINNASPTNPLTVTGPSTTTLVVLNSTNAGGCYTQYELNGASKGYVGWIPTGSSGMGFLNAAGGTANLLVTDAGYIGSLCPTPYSQFTLIGQSGYTTPSLTAQTPAQVSIGVNGGTELTICNTSATNFPVAIQVRHQTINGYTYPLLLNPLGGNVGVGSMNPAAIFTVQGPPNNNIGMIQMLCNSNNPGISWMTLTGGSSRNWAAQTNYQAWGNLDFMCSTGAGGNPTAPVMSLNPQGATVMAIAPKGGSALMVNGITCFNTAPGSSNIWIGDLSGPGIQILNDAWSGYMPLKIYSQSITMMNGALTIGPAAVSWATGAITVAGNRNYFYANSEPFAIGLAYTPTSTGGCYIGVNSANQFQLSNSGGGAGLLMDQAYNVTMPNGAVNIGSAGIAASAGDLGIARNGGATAALYFGNAGRYIYFDGTNWNFNPPLPTSSSGWGGIAYYGSGQVALSQNWWYSAISLTVGPAGKYHVTGWMTLSCSGVAQQCGIGLTVGSGSQSLQTGQAFQAAVSGWQINLYCQWMVQLSAGQVINLAAVGGTQGTYLLNNNNASLSAVWVSA